MTHCRLSREKSSAVSIEGRATFTIETSRIVMKKAAHTTVSAFQRSGSGTAVLVTAASIRTPPLWSQSIVRRRTIQPQIDIPGGGSMAEVAAAREDHGGSCLRDRGDHVLVPARAAGLNDRGRAGVESDLRTVRKREERV